MLRQKSQPNHQCAPNPADVAAGGPIPLKRPQPGAPPAPRNSGSQPAAPPRIPSPSEPRRGKLGRQQFRQSQARTAQTPPEAHAQSRVVEPLLHPGTSTSTCASCLWLCLPFCSPSTDQACVAVQALLLGWMRGPVQKTGASDLSY